MQESGRLPYDRARVLLRKSQTDHAGHEDGAVHAFGVAVDMAVFAGHAPRDIGHAGRQRPIDVAAELWTDGEPELVVAGMAAIRRRNAAEKIEPRLLARAPGTAGVFLPLLAKLRGGHVEAVLLEDAHRAHFVVPVVVDRGDRVQLGKL